MWHYIQDDRASTISEKCAIVISACRCERDRGRGREGGKEKERENTLGKYVGTEREAQIRRERSIHISGDSNTRAHAYTHGVANIAST